MVFAGESITGQGRTPNAARSAKLRRARLLAPKAYFSRHYVEAASASTDRSFVALAGVDAVPVVRARAPHRCSRASAAAARATNHAACISGELLDRVGGLHLAGDQNGSPLVSCYAASCPACDPSQARIE